MADDIGRGADPRSQVKWVFTRYTGRTSNLANFHVSRIIHLRLLRKDPFLATGAKSRFSLEFA